jgi:hypothetical protein
VTVRQRAAEERHLNKEGKEYQPYSQASHEH